MKFKTLLLISSVCVISLVTGCAAAGEVIDTESELKVSDVQESAEFSFQFDIDEYRIRPEYAFFATENEIPVIFQPDSSRISESARNAGFRIQLVSTQDVRQVEELRRKFNQWIFEEVDEYDAQSYIIFRQPFFRLHVGNFRSRAEAIEFNNIVKRKFPEAWVVHDQIDTENITRRITPGNGTE